MKWLITESGGIRLVVILILLTLLILGGNYVFTHFFPELMQGELQEMLNEDMPEDMTFGDALDEIEQELENIDEYIPTTLTGWVFILSILAAVVLLEELAFRLVPFYLYKKFLLGSYARLAVVIFVSSVLFMLAHIPWGMSWHPLATTFSGILFSIAFLKAGGINKHYLKALAASFAVHFLANLIAFGNMYSYLNEMKQMVEFYRGL